MPLSSAQSVIFAARPQSGARTRLYAFGKEARTDVKPGLSD